MKTIRLENGLEMPAFGLGTWKSAPGEVGAAVIEAVRAGYRHIDCAWIYGNEGEIGEALRRLFDEGVVTRDELWVTSKLWNDRHAPDDVEEALRGTLRSLELERIDLYLIHWPIALKKGVVFPREASEMISLEALPVGDTWQGMEALVDKGLCRAIGVSNFSGPKLEGLLGSARIKPVVNQIELHPYLQQPQLFQLCQRAGVAVTAYSPLGSPDRPGTLKARDEPVLLDDPEVAEIAKKHGITPAQVLIAWVLNKGASVIPKSVNAERIRQNIEAASVVLDESDMARMVDLDRHRRYVDGAFWGLPGGPYSAGTIWDE